MSTIQGAPQFPTLATSLRMPPTRSASAAAEQPADMLAAARPEPGLPKGVYSSVFQPAEKAAEAPKGGALKRASIALGTVVAGTLLGVAGAAVPAFLVGHGMHGVAKGAGIGALTGGVVSLPVPGLSAALVPLGALAGATAGFFGIAANPAAVPLFLAGGAVLGAIAGFDAAPSVVSQFCDAPGQQREDKMLFEKALLGLLPG